MALWISVDHSNFCPVFNHQTSDGGKERSLTSPTFFLNNADYLCQVLSQSFRLAGE